MNVQPWTERRPKSAWLPAVDDRRYVTGVGTYRFGKPRLDPEACDLCSLCWVYCPEGAVTRGEGRVIFDYADCRGCGLCAHECPRQAITMVEELDA